MSICITPFELEFEILLKDWIAALEMLTSIAPGLQRVKYEFRISGAMYLSTSVSEKARIHCGLVPGNS